MGKGLAWATAFFRETNEQGRIDRLSLGLSSLNNFGRLWAIEVVS